MGPARYIDSSTPDLCSFRFRLRLFSIDSTSGRVFPADVLCAWTSGGTEAKTTRTLAMTVSLQFHFDAFAFEGHSQHGVHNWERKGSDSPCGEQGGCQLE